ncbi:hypothetical protein E4K10_26085 [Streptomyces sp. T1317-0309]|nr:hypothetical protein E4K10_26085 [Streptomyces sp. T1317-0309]
MARTGHQHTRGRALPDDLLQAQGRDAQQGDGRARLQHPAVVRLLAHRRDPDGQLAAELVVRGLLVAGVLEVADEREVGGEAEHQGSQQAQRGPGERETGAFRPRRPRAGLGLGLG